MIATVIVIAALLAVAIVLFAAAGSSRGARLEETRFGCRESWHRFEATLYDVTVLRPGPGTVLIPCECGSTTTRVEFLSDGTVRIGSNKPNRPGPTYVDDGGLS